MADSANPAAPNLDDLFPGSNEELLAFVEWANSVLSELQSLSVDLTWYLDERDLLPDTASQAARDARRRASSLVDMLLGHVAHEFTLAAEVWEKLSPALRGMTEACTCMQGAQYVSEFERAFDMVLAISGRYKHELREACRGCCLAIEARRRSLVCDARSGQIEVGLAPCIPAIFEGDLVGSRDGGRDKTGGVPQGKGEKQATLALDDKSYFVSAFGVEGRFQKLKGFTQLRRLIERSGRKVPMRLLYSTDLIAPSSAVVNGDELSTSTFTRQEAFDECTLENLSLRHQELNCDLEKAQADGDSLVVDEIQEELRGIAEYTAASMGIGGTPRSLNSEAGKLRPAIYGTLKTAYQKLREARPSLSKLADHFEHYIESEGDCFSYKPGRDALDWSFDPPKRDL